MSSQTVKFTWIRGTDFDRVFRRKNPNGSPIDCSSIEMEFVVRSMNLPGVDKLRLSTADPVNANGSIFEYADRANGVLNLHVAAADTVAAEFDQGNWRTLIVYSPTSKKKHASGPLIVQDF